ncbi:MAG: hypothetical protein EH225_03370 [Calditrichaeota bacterium]|nr:hypothetical protein [Calditrichota bacterium]RQV93523.1 MAG: hypothetical protein EH221_09490 [bacterium]RQW06437.1 MAG: hypothetical protein EH225_03370 [Calditrichota bacterium]
MTLFYMKDSDNNSDDFHYDDSDSDEEDDLPEDDEDEVVSSETEDEGELEEIESKLDRGEDVALSALETKVIAKSQTIYSCPRCKKIFFNKKWVKDVITDIYTVQTQLAYCPKCIDKTYENFIGSIEIFDKNLKDRKEKFIETARQIEHSLEDAPPFENIINIVEKNGILFIFTNTTRLALEIGKALRQELGGGIQYEWFERNQYLRIKWYDEVDNKSYFKEKLRALKDRRFGMFAFEDED